MEFIDTIPSSPHVTDDLQISYFMRREDFKNDLMQNDDEFCYSLIKQYVRRALLTEKEIAAPENLGADALAVLKAKRTDFYICCYAGLANMEWNLNRINQGIHVNHLRSLFRNLLLYYYPIDVDSKATDNEIFLTIVANPDEYFTSDNLFAAWLYARWIAFLDYSSRFPLIVTTQTVSNPGAYADHSLLQAEQHGRSVVQLREIMNEATGFLQRVLDFKITRMRIPIVDCFIGPNPVNDENFNVFENSVEPDFSASMLFIPMSLVVFRTRFELMQAHFTSCHFTTAKNHLQTMLNDQAGLPPMDPSFLSYVEVTEKQLKFYSKALGILPSDPLPVHGGGFDVVVGRRQFPTIDVNVASPEDIRKLRSSQKWTPEQLKHLTAAELHRMRMLKVLPTEPLTYAAPPTDAEIHSFLHSGPQLFTEFATTDPDELGRCFEGSLITTARNVKFPERLAFKQALADCVHRFYKKETFGKLYLLLGKLMQLQNVRSSYLQTKNHWEKTANLIVRLAKGSNMPSDDLVRMLFFDLLDVNLAPAYAEMFCKNVFIPDIVLRFERILQLNFLTIPVVLKFFRFYLPSLVNMMHFDELKALEQRVKEETIVPMVVQLATVMTETGEAQLIARRKFFTMYSSLLKTYTFEAPNSKKHKFPFEDFLTLIECIWHPEAVKLLLNYTLAVYNRELSEYKEHYLVSSASARSCYLMPDSNIQDTGEIIEWGVYNDVLRVTMNALVRIANRVCPDDPFVLRATGDYRFLTGKYEIALRKYLSCVLVCTKNLQSPLQYYLPFIDDFLWRKMITCLVELKRPTEAAITGHLINQMFEFLPYVKVILSGTDDSLDAGPELFHMLGDIAVYEAMSIAYGRLKLDLFQTQLIEKVLTKIFTANTPKSILIHESLRRKEQWLRYLVSRVFVSELCL